MTVFLQAEFNIRCEWGLKAVSQFAPISDAVVIVDVLSFSTCVDIAVGRGATVFPFGTKDVSAQKYADEQNALLALHQRDNPNGYTLSPTSLATIPADTRIVLPSPNGSTLSIATGNTPTFCACLRNAQAVAQALQAEYETITVIPAGERWKDDWTLRPALEDLLGAGAVIHYLQGNKSPEAQLAEMAFLSHRDNMLGCFKQIGSGKELIERGFASDVELASQINISHAVPKLNAGAYFNFHTST